MTNEKAIEIMSRYKQTLEMSRSNLLEMDKEAFTLAIEALGSETTDECNKGNIVCVPTAYPKLCHKCKWSVFSNKDNRWYCGAGDSEMDPHICEKAFTEIDRKELIG